jgi:hypothetical protein
MIQTSAVSALAMDALVAAYFQQSEGEWHSQRRYYTLKDGETQEVVSHLSVTFLPQGSPQLIELAQMHGLNPLDRLTSGALTTWQSNYIGPSPKTLSGSTLFGVASNLLYRDRGFSTSKPVTARFEMRDPKTMCLKTEYGGNVFEEEVKLIGSNYRTRQTIISRLGEEQMIGQYLETRVK